MKLLITGGAGFIGCNFIRHVLGSGKTHEIVNFDKLTYAGNLANLERWPRTKTIVSLRVTSAMQLPSKRR